MPIFRRLYDLERRWRAHFDVAPVDAETWRRARIYNAWFDHAILRTIWTNQVEIAPGVYRSNHPTEARLRRLKKAGLASILSLRGSAPSAHNATERIWCEQLGLTLHAVSMADSQVPTAAKLNEVIAALRRMDRPFLIHCKSGADRAGLVSAIYLMTFEKRPLAEARRMLSWRFYHVRNSRAGALDAVLDAYEADGAEAALPFEDWVASRYDAEAVARDFAARRGKQR
jgi:protein tyrosine/serine phosphatase